MICQPLCMKVLRVKFELAHIATLQCCDYQRIGTLSKTQPLNSCSAFRFYCILTSKFVLNKNVF